MKCIICKSLDIELKEVEEELKIENNIILIPIEVLACNNCGERYYDRKTMKKLEESEKKIKEKIWEVESVGEILRAKVA